jgi:hypothetical protein
MQAFPCTTGNQGRSDDCAALRITSIDGKNGELKTVVACSDCAASSPSELYDADDILHEHNTMHIAP